MMDNDRLTLVQPEGAISHHAMQQRSMWREIFTPVVMMYTLAYFCLTNTLSAISIWTPQILQSFNQGSSNITIGLLTRRTADLYHSRDGLLEPSLRSPPGTKASHRPSLFVRCRRLVTGFGN